jgi:hypothetical protein
LFDESGATYVYAWRRFLFRFDPIAGCNSSLHTVIFISADFARHRRAEPRRRPRLSLRAIPTNDNYHLH